MAWGDSEKWHYNTSKHLRSKGHSVHNVTTHGSELSKKLLNSNFKPHYLKVGAFSYINPIKKIKLTKLLSKLKLDSIILNCHNDAKLVGIVAYNLKIKKVIFRRVINNPIKPTRRNLKIYKRYITDFIANSREAKRSIYKNITSLKSKISIIYNGVDLHEIPRLKPIQSKVIIGNLGSLVEQNGHIHLIEVAKVLKNKEIQFEMHIAGSGPMKEKLNALIKKEDLNDEVKLLGNVQNKDFLSSVDICVFPSLFEGLTNIMLEAQLYQKPTVAFNTASNNEVITHGYNGLLIPPFNTNLMASALDTLSKSNLVQNWFQKNSLNILNEKFNQKRMTSKLEELLEL